MNTIQELSIQIHNQLSPYLSDSERPDMVQAVIEQSVKWYLEDVFKIVKNVLDTCLNEADKADRLVYLEKKFGIPARLLYL